MEHPGIRPIVFLPGGIMPAAIQYEPLLNALKTEKNEPFLHDLELYRNDVPPADYSLAMEVESLLEATEKAGLKRFHLVGYSAGGAVALAFIGAHPERVKSLALTEPAVIPSPEWFQEENEMWAEMEQIMTLPPAEQMREFIRIQLRPGVPLPPSPSGDPPPWMAKRPLGLQTFSRVVSQYPLSLERLRLFHQPVYLAIGALSSAVEERKAAFLARLFPDFRKEVYEVRHHFDPPQRAEAERYARALEDLWERSESRPEKVSRAQ
jgi:pimeloyl-ACP methyl ester carboxylesterase